MPALAEVHLVSDSNNPGEALARPMVALPDHPTHLGEAGEARRLRTTEVVALEVWNHGPEQIAYRPGLVLEGPIGPRCAEPSTPRKTPADPPEAVCPSR
jgi:hypothetical protein